jgi:hypothetical protein
MSISIAGAAAGTQKNREPRAPRGDRGDRRAGGKPDNNTKTEASATESSAPSFTSAKSRKAAKEAAAASKSAAVKSKRGKLSGFSHLPLSIYDQFALDTDSVPLKRAQVASLHAAFLTCLQQLVQSNLCVTRRTELLLNACKQFVAAYVRPSDKVSFLQNTTFCHCRPVMRFLVSESETVLMFPTKHSL